MRVVKSMNQLAKNKKRWHRELKEHLMGDLGIQHCESCGTSYGLSIMHARKQRYITDRDEYFRAAIVCLPEHQSYDEGTGNDVHARMASFVDNLIAKRE